MVWFRGLPLSLGVCMALRGNKVTPDDETQNVDQDEKFYTVYVALTLPEPKSHNGSPEAQNGSAIEFAVNGVRHLSRTHPTQPGESLVLPHIPRGHVVTAHVHASKDACAHWVGATNQQYKVGEWTVAFAISDESDGPTWETVYDAYVEIMGGAQGHSVTIEVNNVHETTYTDHQPNKMFVYPGLHNGVLIKVVSVSSGETCTYRVGSEAASCFLDDTWGLMLESVASTANEDDEGVFEPEEIKNYIVDLGLVAPSDAHEMDIELNGHAIAHKTKSTELGKTIVAYHVKTGSVLTAVSHLTGEACGFYIGTITTQSTICAGWTLNLNIGEENDGTFGDEARYDLSFSVHPGSHKPDGDWGIKANEVLLVTSDKAYLFPTTWGGWSKGTKVVPLLDDKPITKTQCTHVVGGEKTTCDKKGWLFLMSSQLNMNNKLREHHWDWTDETTEPEPDTDDDTGFAFRVTATDTTESKSTLHCIAREEMEFKVAPLGEKDKKMSKGKPLFKPKNLVTTQLSSSLKTVRIELEFVGEYDEKNNLGFMCSVYDEKSNKMCEADSNGWSKTIVKGCTLEINLL